MLFIIDIQNNYLDKNSQGYIKGSEALLPKIIEKIKEYEEKKDEIFYTTDIYTDENTNVTEESVKGLKNNNDLKHINIKEYLATDKEKWGFDIPDKLKLYLKKRECLKKSHYGLPLELMAEIQERFKKEKKIIKEIEILGVETHICVLSNAVVLRSAFPDAKIIINSKLCMSRDMKKHEDGLNLMESLGIEIRR